MIHLIYVSSATNEMTDDELLYLLEQCRSRNLRQHVTGMLLYFERNFIQVLEGEKKDVEEIYDDIVDDDRNTGNILIAKEEIKERAFPGWSMGYKHITKGKKEELEEYTGFLDREMTPEQIAYKSTDVLILLHSFKE